MRSNLDRARRINQVADDWLLVYPNTQKAQLTAALSKFSDEHLDEIHSFHKRIEDFSVEKKRKVLKDLPKDLSKVIEEMLRAYSEEIERANEAYYTLDTPK